MFVDGSSINFFGRPLFFFPVESCCTCDCVDGEVEETDEAFCAVFVEEELFCFLLFC